MVTLDPRTLQLLCKQTTYRYSGVNVGAVKQYSESLLFFIAHLASLKSLFGFAFWYNPFAGVMLGIIRVFPVILYYSFH